MPYEKVGKNEPVCIVDEVPFEIPDSWEWVRLGNIFNIRSAMRIHQTDWKTTGIPFFRGRELVQLIKNGKVDFEIYLSRELYENNKAKGGVPQKDDILITAVGSIGQTYIVKGTQEFYYKDAYILCLENIGRILLPEYIKMVLDSPFSQTDIHKDAMATTVAQLTIAKANSLFIPIPPVEEQKRIIKKLNDIIPHILDYDKCETKLSSINARFPELLKKSILQQAVMGKLVPQDPNDEPASVLLERIRAEKQELIKAGKLKKDKHESIIYRRDNSHYEKLNGVERCIDDEIPFEIPDCWEWVRFGSIINLQSGQDLTPDKYNDKCNGIPYITGASNIEDSTVIINRWTEHGRAFAYRGDLLLTCKGTVGKMAFLEKDQVHIARQIMAIHPYDEVDSRYVRIVLETLVDGLKAAAKSMIPGISREDVLTSLFPLPPLNEQRRITKMIGIVSKPIGIM